MLNTKLHVQVSCTPVQTVQSSCMTTDYRSGHVPLHHAELHLSTQGAEMVFSLMLLQQIMQCQSMRSRWLQGDVQMGYTCWATQ